MTAYVPRHAVTSPRTRPAPWKRIRRPRWWRYRSAAPAALYPCCVDCIRDDGTSDCSPPNRHTVPCVDCHSATGQLAAVHPREHLGPERPTTLQRPDGQVVIDEHHHVELYPHPWPPAGRPFFTPAQGEPRPDVTLSDLPVARPCPDVAPDAYAWMRRDYFEGAPVTESVSAWRPDAVTAEGERLPQVIA